MLFVLTEGSVSFCFCYDPDGILVELMEEHEHSSVLKQLAPFLTRGLFLTVRDAQNASGRRGSDSFSVHLLGRADTSTSSQKELL